MNVASARGVTTLLDQVNGGKPGAFNELVNAVYQDLRKIAANAMRQKFHGRVEGLTVQPTEIANEAVMELCRQYSEWKNAEQFFAIAATLIFRLVGQYRKKRGALKRGAGRRGASLDDHAVGLAAADDAPRDEPDEDSALDALERLLAVHPRPAEVLTLTVLCGEDQATISRKVGVGIAQVQRDLRFAKAWMKDALGAKS